MAILTIRKLDESIKQSLRIKAAHHGISMEEEVSRILQKVLAPETGSVKLGTTIHQHFTRIGNVDDHIPPTRSVPCPVPGFTEEPGQ